MKFRVVCLIAFVAMMADGLSGPLHAAKITPQTLVNQNGKTIRLPDGNPWVITFIFTSCRGVCPALMQNMKAIEDSLPENIRKKINFGAVTIDPETDTVATMKKYSAAHHFDSQNHSLLRAEPDDLNRFIADIKFDYKPDSSEKFQHVNLIVLVDRDGTIAHRFYGLKPNVSRIKKEIENLAR